MHGTPCQTPPCRISRQLYNLLWQSHPKPAVPRSVPSGSAIEMPSWIGLRTSGDLFSGKGGIEHLLWPVNNKINNNRVIEWKTKTYLIINYCYHTVVYRQSSVSFSFCLYNTIFLGWVVGPWNNLILWAYGRSASSVVLFLLKCPHITHPTQVWHRRLSQFWRSAAYLFHWQMSVCSLPAKPGNIHCCMTRARQLNDMRIPPEYSHKQKHFPSQCGKHAKRPSCEKCVRDSWRDFTCAATLYNSCALRSA